MPPVSSHLRLLLRGSAVLIALAILWWCLLLTPLLFVFRNAAEFLGGLAFGSLSCGSQATTASGDWKFCVPMDMTVPNRRGPGRSHVTSAEFAVEPSGLFGFTFGLPVYWAVILASPWSRRSVRPLILGTAVTATLEIVLLLVFLKTYARFVVAQSNPLPDEAPNWFFFLAQYMAVNVAPNLVPFLVALSLHRDLRSLILGWTGGNMLLPVKPPRAAKALRTPMTATAGRNRRW